MGCALLLREAPTIQPSVKFSAKGQAICLLKISSYSRHTEPPHTPSVQPKID